MEEGRSEIIAGIRDLRAKAAARLTGNAYYMIVQQLDSLEKSADLDDETANSIYKILSARLNDGAASAAAGDPEVPSTPATPAEPDAPDTPEEPNTPDSPARPEPSGDPEIPSPPTSPAGPPTPSETRTGAENIEVEAEAEQVIMPKANSFSAPQATVAISFAPVEDDEPAEEDGAAADAPPEQTGLGAAAEAALGLAKTHLAGNRFFTAANLLATLRNLPDAPPADGDTASEPGDFNEALARLRQEAGRFSGAVENEAMRLIGALEGLVAPEPEQAATSEAAPQAAEPVQAETVANEPPPAEPEPAAPPSGFDKLADASWRRVEEVTQAERGQAQSLNGSVPPRAAAAPAQAATPVQPAQPATPTPAAAPPIQRAQAATPPQAPTPGPVAAPVEPTPTPAAAPPIRAAQAATSPQAPAAPPISPDQTTAPVEQVAAPVPPAPAPAAVEPMAQDMGEAFSDGGSERRSSEPCYAGEFEEWTQLSTTPAHHQPASKTVEQAAEAAGKTAPSAEAEAVGGADAAEASTSEAASEIAAEHAESASIPGAEAIVAEAQPDLAAPAASTTQAGTTIASHSVAEESAAGELTSERPPSDQTASTETVAADDQPEAVASADLAAGGAEAERTKPALEKAAEKPARAGFFSRLFGSRPAKIR